MNLAYMRGRILGNNHQLLAYATYLSDMVTVVPVVGRGRIHNFAEEFLLTSFASYPRSLNLVYLSLLALAKLLGGG